MKWRSLQIGLAAVLVAGLAFAQPRPSEQPTAPTQPAYPLTRECITQQGQAVPCALSDIPQPGVAPANTVPDGSKPALVVTLSPNSPAPGYPPGATPVTAHGTGTTGAVTATLAAVVQATNYVCGFSVSPGSAASAITITEVLSGISGGSMTWAVAAPVTAAGTTGSTLTQTFNPCIPASASNTAIVITSGALGASGVNNDAQLWGYYK